MYNYRRFLANLLPLILLFLVCGNSLEASTIQVPDWYLLDASLSSAPEMGKPLAVKIKLQALIGDLNNSRIKIILPDSWSADKAEVAVATIKEGNTTDIEFAITPATFLRQGSIVIEAALHVPVQGLADKIKKEFAENAAVGLIESVKKWPALTKRYADISFAMLEEESFYPLSGDMWLAYDDKLSPAEGFRGPVFYEDSIITVHQAQTDLEMFEKLENYTKADPQLLAKMIESGIDIDRKRQDQFIALYVLAVKSYQERNFHNALNFLERFASRIANEATNSYENMKIAAANLRGLTFWAQGNRRLAEDSLKKAFYSNRKNPLQRYVLRNLGLLMLAGNDRNTAAEMFRLAQSMKQGYTLLTKENDLLKKN